MISFWNGMGSAEVWGIIFLFLLIFEVLTADVFILWLSASALTVAVTLLFLDIVWIWQISIFSVAVYVFLVVSRCFHKKGYDAVSVVLNQRGAKLVGCEFVLENPIQRNYGRLEVDGTSWLIKGSDCIKESKVRVIGIDGVILLVEPVDCD